MTFHSPQNPWGRCIASLREALIKDHQESSILLPLTILLHFGS